jgi:hypothetical protein
MRWVFDFLTKNSSAKAPYTIAVASVAHNRNHRRKCKFVGLSDLDSSLYGSRYPDPDPSIKPKKVRKILISNVL